jgi:small subunit ribosomal protein S8
MTNDPIADMLTRIRNASQALLPEVEVQHSKMKECIAQILKREGYITDYHVQGDAARQIQVKLKYLGRKGVIEKLQRASRPGLRRYVHAMEIPRVLGGMGTVIMSTSRGIMTGTDARKQNLGGELICYVC